MSEGLDDYATASLCSYFDIYVRQAMPHDVSPELEASIRGLFAWSPDVKFELKSCFGSGEWVASEWVMSGTHAGSVPGIPATGKSFSIRGSWIYELRKGRISRDCDYWNLASFLQQVGLMP